MGLSDVMKAVMWRHVQRDIGLKQSFVPMVVAVGLA